MKNRLELFLSDLTYNAKYEFLDYAKHKKELDAIAKKKGIKLPANDLAIFKCRYAFVDRENKNGCTLPMEEAKKALDTLAFKAIDFDHFRRNVVGTWIDATIEKDEIIAYGLFYKGNFPDDYAEIKELMEKDVLAISFEAWGVKDIKEDGSYNLTDIEFAGGALLIKSKPAFDGAEVLEMSNKKVLEFSKIMTAPENFLHTGDGEKNKKEEEFARYYVYDIENISRLIGQVECLGCKEKFMLDILSVDFEESKASVKCVNCEAKMDISLTPTSKLTKKGRKIKDIKISMDKSDNKGEVSMKKLLEEYKKDSIDEVLQDIAKVSLKRELSAEEITKAKTKVEAKGEEVSKQDAETIVAEFKKDETRTASTDEKAKDTEISKLKEILKTKDTEVAKLKEDVIKITNEVAEFKASKIKAETERKDALVKERKEKLGEFAKDVSDEDLLNDDKFNLLALKQDNEKMKQALTKANVNVTELEIGSDKQDSDPIGDKCSRIQKLAFE